MGKIVRRAGALALTVLLGCAVLAACGGNNDTPGNETTAPVSDKGYYTAEDYLTNPELFVPKWADEWTPPSQMLDFEEKYQQYFTPNGRVLSVAHRGDRNVYYPENSIEGILSVIMAGADMVEIDVTKSKDGIPVVIHDDDLLRTTNLSLLRLNGQAEGLPQSNNVADWTLEELRKLRLIMSETSGEVTNYVIPTLEDVIMVCKDRCFIALDKFWRFDWNMDVVPLIEKHGAYRTVMIPYRYTRDMGYVTVSYLMKRLENASGYKPGCTAYSTPETVAQVAADIVANNFPMAITVGEYSRNDPAFLATYAPYVGKYRLEGCTLERDNDFPGVWEEMADNGFNIIMCNVNPYELCKFVAQRHFS